MKIIKKHIGVAMKNKLLLFLLLFLFTGVAVADVLVKAVHGNSGTVLASPGNNRRSIKPLSVIKTGECISVIGKDDYVDVVGDDGKVVHIDAKKSPYPVPGKESLSWFNNAQQAALDWFAGLSEREVLAISLISRGGETTDVTLVGMDRSENLILKDIASLKFIWAGGEAPYRVQLFAEDGSLKFENSVENNEVLIDIKDLDTGDYLVRISSDKKDRYTADEQMFTLINADALPINIQSLDQQVSDSCERNQLKSIMLALYSEWKFYALQIAYTQNNEKLVSHITAGE